MWNMIFPKLINYCRRCDKVVFNEYAHYYDLLYKDKNYCGEAEYIDKLIKKYKSGARDILDLGCGTGRHAELLAQKGYTVHGVDMSQSMLEEAQKRAEENDNLSFSLSDIQEFNLCRRYDVTTAFFHVMSYQLKDEALEKVFLNVKNHLQESGMFLFDCWYGPAVLIEKPEIRVKRLENDNVKITRIAEPVMRENENIVEVHYDVFVQDKVTGKIKEIRETHMMRYLFIQEIINIANKCGFNYIDSFEFGSSKPLSKHTWGSCFVLKLI